MMNSSWPAARMTFHVISAHSRAGRSSAIANCPSTSAFHPGLGAISPAVDHFPDARAPGVDLLIGHGPAFAFQEVPDMLAIGQLHLSPELRSLPAAHWIATLIGHCCQAAVCL